MARSRIKSLAINTQRANAALINEIIDQTVDAWIGGADFDECLDQAKEQIADAAVKHHGDKVRAALARAGIEIPEGELTVEGVREALQAKSGLEIEEFSAAGILKAVDAEMAKKLTEVTGIEIESVVGNDLQTTIKVGVRAALRDGMGYRLIGVLMQNRARKLATLKRLNSNQEELTKFRNRQYQAKYRKTHKQQWQ